jgi:TolA-binding protein
MDNYSQGEEELLHIIKTYPAFEKIPKARFLIGWMAMLEQDYGKARKVFESVLKDYPEAAFAEHARDFLSRIPDST